jgi:hypothetical protein
MRSCGPGLVSEGSTKHYRNYCFLPAVTESAQTVTRRCSRHYSADLQPARRLRVQTLRAWPSIQMETSPSTMFCRPHRRRPATLLFCSSGLRGEITLGLRQALNASRFWLAFEQSKLGAAHLAFPRCGPFSSVMLYSHVLAEWRIDLLYRLVILNALWPEVRA